jgi:hypothetical protein
LVLLIQEHNDTVVCMQINPANIVTSLSPQLGYAGGCSSPIQPYCSARLRSLLDDYQVMLAIRFRTTVGQNSPESREVTSSYGRQRCLPACRSNRHKKNGHTRHGKQHQQYKAVAASLRLMPSPPTTLRTQWTHFACDIASLTPIS